MAATSIVMKSLAVATSLQTAVTERNAVPNIPQHPSFEFTCVCSYSPSIDFWFTYDQVSEKYLKDLEKLARFEGYYDDAKDEFEALSKKLKHNIAKDLDYPYNKQKIKEMIAADILSAYYFERGSIENALRTDKQMAEAVKLLKNKAEYRKLLEPNKEDTKTSKAEDKQGKAEKKQGKNKKK